MTWKLYNGNLCTVNDVIVQMERQVSSTPTVGAAADNDAFVQFCENKIPAYSRLFQSKMSRAVAPFYGTLELYFKDLIYGRGAARMYAERGVYQLILPADLLSVTSITWDGNEASSDDYRLYSPAGTANDLPYIEIQFDRHEFIVPPTSFNSKIEIEGLWGYHNDLDALFFSRSAVGNASGISDSDTSIEVADASFFSRQGYIRIGTELMLITVVDTTSTPNTLTVRRGVQGSTADTHANNATIERVDILDDIRAITARAVAYAWETRTAAGNTIVYPDGLTVLNNMPAIVKQTLELHTRAYFGSV